MSADQGTSPSTSNSPPITQATSPFDETHIEGTVILRSSDRVDFYVNRGVLSPASPVFKDMFSLPQPRTSDTETGGNSSVPVVDVTEDGKTLRHLLILCYPVNKPDLKTIKEIIPVLTAAQKYDMEWPITYLTRDLLAVIPRSPLLAWAVASRSGLNTIVERSAREIRDRVVPPKTAISIMKTMMHQEGGSDILEGISAGEYYRLREFLSSPSMPDYPSPPEDAWPPYPASPTLRLPPSSPSPDVIIRCSDKHKVQTHRVILAVLSSTLITDTPATDPVLRIPVHYVAIRAQTLVDLLRICYWGEDALPSDLRRLASMIAAAERYEMTRALRDVKKQWDKCAAGSPLEAYFVSAMNPSLGSDMVKMAAKKTLEKPLGELYVGIMEEASAVSYHNLLKYHTKCALSVREELRRTKNAWKSAVQPAAGTGSLSSSTKFPPSSLSSIADRLDSMNRKIEKGDKGPLGSVAEFSTHALLSTTDMYFWPGQGRESIDTVISAMLDIETALQPAIWASIDKVELAL